MIRKAEGRDLAILAELACRLWPHHTPVEMRVEFGQTIPKPDGVCFLFYIL